MVSWNVSLPGSSAGNIIRSNDPPLTVPGMAFVRLGPRGKLLELRVVPDPTSRSTNAPNRDAMLTTIVRAAGLEASGIEELDWGGIPAMPGSPTLAWRVTDRREGVPPRIIVVTLAVGWPTWVKVMPASPSQADPFPTPAEDRMSLVFFLFFVGGALLAAHNIRAGQWDRRGAGRLATAAFALCFASELIGSHHSFHLGAEVRGFFAWTAYAAVRSLMTWLLYVAIEPFIRRLLPQAMISWSRLLAGRLRNPAVGRDVLVGLAVLAIENAALGAWTAGRGLLASITPYWAFMGGQSPLDTSTSLAITLRVSVVSLGSTFGFLLVYVVFRRLVGRFRHVAPVLLWLALFFFYFWAYNISLRSPDMAAFAIILATGATYLAVRHGLLAFAVSGFVGLVQYFTVLTTDPTDWYFAPTAIFVALVVGLTVFGVRVSADRSVSVESGGG